MAKKVDLNQAEIVKAFRQVGATVHLLHAVGKGCPDLLVGYKGINYLIEVKGEKGRLTPAQVKWHEEWKGLTFIVRTIEEAYQTIGIL